MLSYADIASLAADTFHALATVAIPAALTLALVWWCTEFYRREPFGERPVYLALLVTTAACVALTTMVFVSALV